TADRLQGGQWAAVVSLDPFFGSPVGSSHSASLGRLCVMVSRHIAHLTWVTSSDWREVIESTHMDEDDAAAHVAVREAMAADSVACALLDRTPVGHDRQDFAQDRPHPARVPLRGLRAGEA